MVVTQDILKQILYVFELENITHGHGLFCQLTGTYQPLSLHHVHILEVQGPSTRVVQYGRKKSKREAIEDIVD